jgi:dolichol-phosphate mannosyltransferase
MDADDTHTPGLILRMVRHITEGCDVVIASRYQPGSRTIGVPWSRRLLSYGASILFRVVFPTPGVRDYTCGYRAYRADAIQDAVSHYGQDFLNQDGFQCMVDILLKLRTRHLIFGEVPFILRYDQKEGGTKMRVWRTVRQTLSLLVARRLGK